MDTVNQNLMMFSKVNNPMIDMCYTTNKGTAVYFTLLQS